VNLSGKMEQVTGVAFDQDQVNKINDFNPFAGAAQ
jgi:hypothetical protein